VNDVENNRRDGRSRFSRILAISLVTILLSAVATGGINIAPFAKAEKPLDNNSGKPPQLRISSPSNGETLVAGGINVVGTSSDSLTLNVIVSIRIDSGEYEPAIPRSSNDFSDWSALMDIMGTGSHTIEAKARDNNSGKTVTKKISITVTSPSPSPFPSPTKDTSPPSISAPADIMAEATGPQTAMSLGSPTVSDDIDPSPSVTNDAPSGFPVGTTMVKWTATDDSSNSASDLQAVVVRDTTAPVVKVPLDQVAEAVGPAGAYVSYPSSSATDNVGVVSGPACTPAAGSLFPLGSTIVTCTAADSAGNVGSALFVVRVLDTTSPTIVAPSDITQESPTGSSITISFLGSPTVNDIVDAFPTISNDASSNSFPIGETLVVWRAVDDYGNSAQDIQKVIVTSPTSDNDPLILPKTGAYVPLYMYPGGTGWNHWQTVIDAKNAHPTVPIVASINPSSGVGSSKNTAFVNGITKLKAAGITVIGYVYTDYGARDINVIKSEISKYKEWYNVDGIMFDEMSNSAGKIEYYRQLDDYAKSIGMKYTKGNPGADIAEGYIGTLDNFSIKESTSLAPLSFLGGWHTEYDKSNFSFCVYAQSTLNTSYVKDAAQYVSLMYITNDSGSNPYDTVPPYFEQMVATLEQVH